MISGGKPWTEIFSPSILQLSYCSWDSQPSGWRHLYPRTPDCPAVRYFSSWWLNCQGHIPRIRESKFLSGMYVTVAVSSLCRTLQLAPVHWGPHHFSGLFTDAHKSDYSNIVFKFYTSKIKLVLYASMAVKQSDCSPQCQNVLIKGFIVVSFSFRQKILVDLSCTCALYKTSRLLLDFGGVF